MYGLLVSADGDRFAIITPYTAGLVVEESEMDGRLVDGRFERGLRGRIGLPPAPRRSRELGGLLPGSGGRAGGAPSSPAPEDAPGGKAKEARDSAALKKLKEGHVDADDEDKGDGLGAIRDLVKSVAGKTFTKGKDGRWVDKAWDGKKPTTKVEAFSEAYFELLQKSDKIARYLALGEKVVFAIGDVIYEIIPARS